MKRAASFILLCSLLLAARPRPARAQGRPADVSTVKLVAFNMALTGTFAVGRRWAEGRLTNWQDALETFLYAGAGGYGFYHAKRLVGNRKPLAGWALAYLSASVVENAAQGRHPLAYLRLGIGPVDLRWRTPLARPGLSGALLTLDVNLISAISLVALPLTGSRPFLQNGWLYYYTPTPTFGSVNADDSFAGRTFNRTILLYRDALFMASVRAHEAIHVIQALQVGAVTPYYRLSALWPGLDRSLLGFLAWDVQLDWLYLLLAPATLLRDYDNRWTEREAYTLMPEREPAGGCIGPGCEYSF